MTRSALRLFVAGALSLGAASSYAATTCESGFQPHGEVCVTQRMSDFIVCISSIGGNRQEVLDFVSSTAKAGANGKAAANGRGIVITASGSVQVGTASENELARKLETRFFPGGLDACSKVPPPEDAKIGYTETKRREDLRTVQGYIVSNGYVTEDVSPGNECMESEYRSQVTPVVFSAEDLQVTWRTIYSREKCANGPSWIRETIRVCKVKLADLDEDVQVWIGRPDAATLRVPCITGDCIRCESTAKITEASRVRNDPVEVLQINYLTVPVMAGMARPHVEFNAFVRAFSRLVSAGSDTVFCKRNPSICGNLSLSGHGGLRLASLPTGSRYQVSHFPYLLLVAPPHIDAAHQPGA